MRMMERESALLFEIKLISGNSFLKFNGDYSGNYLDYEAANFWHY